MGKAVILYIIAIGIFAIPLYLFRSDIFSGMKDKGAYVRKQMKGEKKNNIAEKKK